MAQATSAPLAPPASFVLMMYGWPLGGATKPFSLAFKQNMVAAHSSFTEVTVAERYRL